MSDLIQFFSERDPSPWANFVGFIPDDVIREATVANHADLLLTSNSKNALIEVKLGHLMPIDQQNNYEALASRPDLYLAALSTDKGRLGTESDRWKFLSLSDLVSGWESVSDDLARLLAREVAEIVRGWDHLTSGVFESQPANRTSLNDLNQKFLARVVTRRMAQDLHNRGRLAHAGVTSGGGLPLIQAWTPVRNEGSDRTFIAEIRWRQAKPGGELRFGVDFDPRPDCPEDEEVRRAAYDLACSMDAEIDGPRLMSAIAEERPELAELMQSKKPGRPKAKGNWESVIAHGFKGSRLQDGRKNNRRRTSPAFYGDGTLRFQAIIEITFDQASTLDLIDLLDFTLTYLSARQPQA